MLQCKTPALRCRRVIASIVVLIMTAAVFPILARAAGNGLGQRPFMGWSSWSSFHKNINEALIRSEADAMAAHLKPVGYTYINMDSGWTTKNFDSNGRPTWDTSKFPNGIPALADYVHSKGLKLGIYLKPGLSTTVLAANSQILGTNIHVNDIAIPSVPGDTETGDSVKIDFTKPGADEYVQSIVNQIASWKVDFVKMDFVGPGGGNIPADSREYLQHFMAAIEKIGYPLWVELSNSLSFSSVTTWQQVANGWRIDGDIESGVSGTLTDWTNVSKRFHDAPKWAPFDAPGGWSDFDALQLGNGSHDGLTVTERQTAATVWAASCAQFFTGADLRSLDSTDLAMMTNTEVIAVDQAGNVATPISQATSQQVWRTTKPNPDGSFTVALFNLGSATATVSVSWSQLGFSGSAGVRDLWSHSNLGTMASGFSASLPSHGSRLLKVTPSSVSADFSISATPASQTVTAGSSTSYTVNIGSQNGFSGSVSLGVNGVPASTTTSFAPAAVNAPGTAALNISTTSSTPAGTYTLTITGTSGSLSHSATITLMVQVLSTCSTASAGGGWVNTPFALQSGTFNATFDATPSVVNINSVAAFSLGAQTSYTGFATLPRFNPSGDIDARNGGAYSAASIIPYSPGVTYHFRLVVNIPSHTYSVFVTAPGGSEQTVGNNFAFRTEQNTVTGLSSMGLFVAGTSGTLRVCNLAIN